MPDITPDSGYPVPSVDVYAPVDHPGVAVPARLRSWSVPFADYAPVNITPPELRPAGLAAAVAQGWAEPYLTPTGVPNWAERQANALVPFELDEHSWPRNPAGRTGRCGRNLGTWGENTAADPIVVAGRGAGRQVLLIRRADRGEWAISGGMIDPGEAFEETLVRELREETGVDLTNRHGPVPEIVTRTYVRDWRNTDHAWVATTAALFRLPSIADVAAPVAGDDAAEARWWPLADVDALATVLSAVGGLYRPHRKLLALAALSAREREAIVDG